MLKATRLRSWNINAPNLDAAVGFYRDLLGATEGRTGNVAGTTVAHVSIGDLTVGLFDASEGPRPGVPHHTIDIDWDGDADSLVKELESRGFKTDGIRQHREDSGFSVYLEDHCGNRLELARS